MDLGKIILPGTMFLFLLIPLASSQNVHTHTFYDTTGATNPQTVYSPSLRTDQTNCSVTITAHIDSITETGSDYEIITQFYSPHGYEAGYGSQPISGNVTCLGHGQITTTTSNESQWESKVITTRSGGSSHQAIITTDYECGFDDDWIDLTTSGYDLDSDGYAPNVYFKYDCIAGPPSYDFFLTSTQQDKCVGLTNSYLSDGDHNFCCGVACVDNHKNLGWWVMPFTTGPSGRIIYEYSAPFIWQAFEEWGYYQTSNPIGTYVQLSTYSGNLTLEPETDYAFYVHGTAPTGNQKTLNINISIEAYKPAWICGSWSKCDIGLKYRTCIDPLDKIPDKIEYQACIDTAIADVLLGFEEGKSPSPANVRKCEKHYYPFCLDGITTLTNYIEYPDNWNVINPGFSYFMEMSNEYATEGSRSLKMWYIPPMWRYIYPGGICNWTNTGAIPQVYKGLNDSLFVEYNITFPSTYMTIDYDVKRCQYPVTQYDGWCGKQCYGYQGNCSDSSVKGEYVSILSNPITSEVIYEFYDEADLSWETKHIDLSYSNITIGETYNLAFAVYPRYQTDAYGHCIYLDNVRLSIREGELDCDANYCIDNDLYKPKQLNQTCIYEIEYNSPECLSEENRGLAENQQDYCIDQTLYSYNNQTAEWEETLNATYCIEQEEEASISEPLPALQAYAQSFLEPIFGETWIFFAFFLTPLFIAFIASLGISAMIVDWVKVNSGEGIIFGISFNGFLGVFSLVGWFPPWYSILMIVVSGAIIAYQIFGKT